MKYNGKLGHHYDILKLRTGKNWPLHCDLYNPLKTQLHTAKLKCFHDTNIKARDLSCFSCQTTHFKGNTIIAQNEPAFVYKKNNYIAVLFVVWGIRCHKTKKKKVM